MCLNPTPNTPQTRQNPETWFEELKDISDFRQVPKFPRNRAGQLRAVVHDELRLVFDRELRTAATSSEKELQ